MRARMCVAAALTALLGLAAHATQLRAATEYEVKAAFLFNFAKFVEWPASAFAGEQAPLVIAVVGDDPFGSALDEVVKGKSVHGRPIMVQRLRWHQDLRACHVLYVGSSKRGRVRKVLETLKEAPVLSVGEAEEFARDGGIINFIMVQSKVRFEINPSAAKRARLEISSQLLRLGKIVESPE